MSIFFSDEIYLAELSLYMKLNFADVFEKMQYYLNYDYSS